MIIYIVILSMLLWMLYKVFNKAAIKEIKNFVKSFFINPYEEEMIDLCVSDYWRLKTEMIFAKDLEELKGWYYDLLLFESKFQDAVPPKMLDDYNNDLKRIYQKLIFKFQN